MTDHRIGPDLFTGVLDVLHRHGFTRGDDEHAGRAIFLFSDLARIYDGSQDHPVGPSISQAPSPQTAPEPPGPDSRNAVIVPASELKTVLAALDIAADYKRDRTEMCADCPDQSCFACQLRLQDARAYDQLAAQLMHDEQATRDERSQPGPVTSPMPPTQPHPAAETEAGQ